MPKGYHHVTLDIRSQIYALKSIGTPLHKISSIVGRHVSTISREISRNTGKRGYRYKQAGFVEGMNNKIKVAKRRCYGFSAVKTIFQRLFLDFQGFEIYA